MMTNRHQLTATSLLETTTNPGWPVPATSSPTNASKSWVPGLLCVTVAEHVVPEPQIATSAPVVSL